MPALRRVFLSHTREFAEYPADKSFLNAATEAILRAGGEVFYDETDDEEPRDRLVEQMQACEVYIGIVGLRYGRISANHPQTSAPELECDVAGKVGLRRFIFLLHEQASVPESLFSDPEHSNRQAAFRRTLTKLGMVTATFSTPEELHDLIYQALSEDQLSESASPTDEQTEGKAAPLHLLSPTANRVLMRAEGIRASLNMKKLNMDCLTLGLFDEGSVRSSFEKTGLTRKDLISLLASHTSAVDELLEKNKGRGCEKDLSPSPSKKTCPF